MKKLFYVVLSGLLLCSCCNQIQLTGGSYQALRQQYGTAEFILDLSQTQAVEFGVQNPFTDKIKIEKVIGTVDERMALAGEDFVRDWPQVYSQMEVEFATAFNRSIGRNATQLCIGLGSTPYQVVFHVTHIDFGSTGANVAAGVVNSIFGDGWFYGGGAGGCIADGTVELIDTLTGETLGVITVYPIKTDGSPSEDARLYDLMRLIGKWSGKRAK